MTLSEYTRLKNQIKINVSSSEHYAHILTTLKGLFAEDINSPRRFEQITTIGRLLEVLELRDVLSEDDVGPLKQMVQFLPNFAELLRKIQEYETCHIPRTNFYVVPEHSQNTQYSIPIAPAPSNNPFGQMSPTKKQRILQTVTTEIGTNWRDLARNLSISERQINDIDHKNKSLPKKATGILEFYLLNIAEPDKWFFELCEGLNKSRRKDLTKAITKILTMNL